jgi:hypothetical protein
MKQTTILQDVPSIRVIIEKGFVVWLFLDKVCLFRQGFVIFRVRTGNATVLELVKISGNFRQKEILPLLVCPPTGLTSQNVCKIIQGRVPAAGCR